MLLFAVLLAAATPILSPKALVENGRDHHTQPASRARDGKYYTKPTPSIAHHDQPQTADVQQNSGDRPKEPGWLGIPFDGWVAIWTLCLFLATSGLWAFTAAMWFSTKKAAQAAVTAAKALPIVERAYAYPEISNPGAVWDCVKDALAFHLDPTGDKADTPCDSTCELTFTVKNFGKTPAILKEIFAGFGIWPIGAQIGMLIPYSVLGAGENCGDMVAQMERGLSYNEANRVITYTGTITFYGSVKFDDIWGIEFITKFAFIWEHTARRWLLNAIETKQT